MSSQTESLISRARHGDKLALQQLLMFHWGELRNHLTKQMPVRLRGVVDVDDVLQEALTIAYLKLDQLQDTSPASFRAWLRTTGEMAMLGILRAERAQKRGGHLTRQPSTFVTESGSLIDLLDALPGDSVTASRVMSHKERVEAIRVAIAGLPEDQRIAVQLHCLQNKSVEETAAQMNRSPASVRSLVHRGKQKLAEVMGQASIWLSHR